jgi:hypothetical protein
MAGILKSLTGILKSLAASTAAAIGRSDLALRLGKSTSYARAPRNERAGMAGEPPAPAAIYPQQRGAARRRWLWREDSNLRPPD